MSLKHFAASQSAQLSFKALFHACVNISAVREMLTMLSIIWHFKERLATMSTSGLGLKVSETGEVRLSGELCLCPAH